jgi:2'-5' RNA ligase
MLRLFVALEIPAELRRRLALICGGVPGARWVAPEAMHVTLRFVGEVDLHRARDIDSTLADLRGVPLTLRLSGIGEFGDKRRPHSLWMGVVGGSELFDLHRRIENRLIRIGLKPDGRNFTPHVTLARLKNSPIERVIAFIAAYNLMSLESFTVDHFTLFSSHPSPEGSRYVVQNHYPLHLPVRVDS